MEPEWFGNKLSNLHTWAQGLVRILENNLHALPHPPHFPGRESQHIDSVASDRASGRFNQAQYGTAKRRFPATRLANDTKYFTPFDIQTDAIHGTHPLMATHPTPAKREVRLKI
jgi:hypothetical protein